jgi:multisubunit Na+/H+ antiporter MnhC subunit
MVAVYLVVGLAAIVGTGVLVYRSRDFRKFLAGAFLVSAGVQFYLAEMGVSIPIAGTGAVQTPEVGLVRASIHTVLFLLTAYFGFIRKPQRAAR